MIFFAWRAIKMRKIKCPECGAETIWENNEYRPFCSERCKLLDLGAWASGEYGLPVEPTNLTEEELAELEKLSEAKAGNER